MLKGIMGHLIWVTGAIGLIGFKYWCLNKLEKYKLDRDMTNDHDLSCNDFVYKDDNDYR